MSWFDVTTKRLKLIGYISGFFAVGTLIMLYTQYTAAATYTWDNGSGDGLWSTCANWSTNVCPGPSDIASFGSSNTSNATIDAAFAGSVAGIDINTGYTGTITQQRNVTVGASSFIQDDGTFVQGTYALDVNYSFTVNAGTFTADAGINTVERSFTIGSSATYTASTSRTWTFDSIRATTFTYPGVFPSSVIVAKSSDVNGSFTLSSGTVLSNPVDVDSALGSVTINSGAEMYTGAFAGFNLTVNGIFSATSTVNIEGSFTLGAAGEFYYDGSSMYIARSYTDNGGVFDETGITFYFDTIFDTVLTYPGVFPSPIVVSKTSEVQASFTVASSTIVSNSITFTTDQFSLGVNAGGILHIDGVSAFSLDVSGTLYASSTIDLSGSFTLGSTGKFYYDSNILYIERNYTDNGGLFDETGKSVVFDGIFTTTLTYPGVFPMPITVAKTSWNCSFTVASGTIVTNGFNITDSDSSLVINAGGFLVATSSTSFTGWNLTIDGTFYASSTVSLAGGYSLGSTGNFFYDASYLYVNRTFSDAGGTFDREAVTFVFQGGISNDHTTFSYTGVYPGPVQIAKTNASARFEVLAATTVNTVTSITSGPVRVYGNLRTQGNRLSAASITVYDGGTLTLFGNETLTNPTLNTGSTVNFNGSGTYTGINVSSTFHNVEFSSGTYNLAGNITVNNNFANTGATFNQTTGTTTFTGTANSVSGNSTFHNLRKTTTSVGTLTFADGSTQTVSGTLTLEGQNTDNRLTIQSSTPGSRWNLNRQGSDVINFVTFIDTNNTSATIINCYDVDCVDGGSNLRIAFEAPPPPQTQYRLRGGTRLMGGVRI